MQYGMANSVEPDQSSSRSSLIWFYDVCPNLSVQKPGIITVVKIELHQVKRKPVYMSSEVLLNKPYCKNMLKCECSEPSNEARDHALPHKFLIGTMSIPARLRRCAGLPEPSRFSQATSAFFACFGFHDKNICS